jgi:hypothetical protein
MSLTFQCSLPVTVEPAKATAEPAWQIGGFHILDQRGPRLIRFNVVAVSAMNAVTKSARPTPTNEITTT